MAEPDAPTAALVVIHEDILLPGVTDAGPASAALYQDEGETTALFTAYYLSGDSYSIGRDSECDIRVRNHRTDISRRHATIRREDAVYRLYDHSKHGTFVNGQRIDAPCRLDTEDIIGFANSEKMLRFIMLGEPQAAATPLSERELDVLRLIAAGQSNKEIAFHLSITLNTVNTHIKSIYDKLNVHSRTEAVNQARKERLI